MTAKELNKILDQTAFIPITKEILRRRLVLEQSYPEIQEALDIDQGKVGAAIQSLKRWQKNQKAKAET